MQSNFNFLIILFFEKKKKKIRQFLRNNIELKIGGVTCGNILGVIEGIKSLSSIKGENIEIPSIQPSSQPNSKGIIMKLKFFDLQNNNLISL